MQPAPDARRVARALIGGLLVLLAAVAAAAPDAPPRRPLEHFASLPMVDGGALSPDGRRVALLVRQGARTALVVREVAGGPLRTLLSVDDAQAQRVRWLRWVSDERLLLGIVAAGQRGFVSTTETRMVSVGADGGGAVDLSQVERVPGSVIRRVGIAQQQDVVVDWLPGDGRAVLVALRRPGDRGVGVFRVDVATGRREAVQPPVPDARHWFTDAAHRVRVGVFEDEDGEVEVRAREPDGDRWRTLWRFGGDRADAVWPLGFGPDPQTLYVQAPHEGRSAVFAVRLDDPALPRRLLLAHAEQDVAGALLRVPGSGEVVGLLDGTDDGATVGHDAVWSPEWLAVWRGLGAALPGRYLRIGSLSHDGRRYLLVTSGSRHGPAWYVGDRDSGQLALLAESYPELSASGLLGTSRVRIAARDGQPLNAYLALPAGRRAGDGGPRLPLVLLPHGGPASRDFDDFDPWTEFLADRGFAVLQVNFRGSAGYGHAFLAAGLRRWGLEMQDDLTDAVQWAVDQGIADRDRLCVVGASYGGYAALMAAVKTPTLFRCAAGFGGVYDLPAMALYLSDYVGGRAAAERLFGDGWRDRERLRATSPALQAARIRVSVLLVHGSEDRVVPVEQGRAMADALRSAGREVDYM